MRRNNIKFGVNKYINNNKKLDQSYYLSEVKSKLKDKTAQMNSNINKPALIKKVFYTEADLQKDLNIGNYQFIDTHANNFHFLID